MALQDHLSLSKAWQFDSFPTSDFDLEEDDHERQFLAVTFQHKEDEMIDCYARAGSRLGSTYVRSFVKHDIDSSDIKCKIVLNKRRQLQLHCLHKCCHCLMMIYLTLLIEGAFYCNARMMRTSVSTYWQSTKSLLRRTVHHSAWITSVVIHRNYGQRKHETAYFTPLT